MSSPRADQGSAPRRGRRPFETWRKIAVSGAFVLLGESILDAATDDFNRVVLTLLLGIGWGLLAAGFGRFMLDRRRKAAEAARKP